MRRLRYLPARPTVLLLLLGVISGRLSVGSPFPALSSLERVVTHPSQHLEEGVYAASESQRKLPALGRRRMLPTTDTTFKAEGLSLKGSAVTRTLSDSGGSLQLLLLLLLCAAVLCCASMSISPWYKSESYVLRKALAVLYVAAAVATEGLRRQQLAGCADGKGGRTHQVQSERSGRDSQAHLEGTLRKGRSKRRKGQQAPAGGLPLQHRLLEKTLSSGNSSMYEASSVHSGEADFETLAVSEKEERISNSGATPADLQIARLEAEAARHSSQRAAKSKRGGKKQAEAVPLIDEPAAIDGAASKSILSTSQKPEDCSSLGTALEKSEKSSRSKKSGSKDSVGASPQKTSKPLIATEGEQRDRLGRKIGNAEKPSTRLSQVLVVPRRPAPRGKERARGRQTSSDDEREAHFAPGTPERAASTAASTFSSPQSSIQSSVPSPTTPARPYAQVAKESSHSVARVPPPPPPPPPPRVGAIPQSAVFAREFRPAAQTPRTTLSAAAPVFSPGQGRSQLSPPPAHVAFLNIQSPERPCPTSSPLPSPFPGMSLHRRLVSPSPQASPQGMSGPAAVATSSGGLGPSTAFRGHGFPGGFDSIWSTSAVGGDSSWLPMGGSQTVSASFDTGKELLSSLHDLLPLDGRQDSW